MENIHVTDVIEHLKTRSYSFGMQLAMTKRNLLNVWNVVKSLPKLVFCGIIGNDILKLGRSNADGARNGFILQTR